MKLKFFNDLEVFKSFNLLLSSDIVGFIILSLNSLFPIAKLNVKSMLLGETLGDCEVNTHKIIHKYIKKKKSILFSYFKVTLSIFLNDF